MTVTADVHSSNSDHHVDAISLSTSNRKNVVSHSISSLIGDSVREPSIINEEKVFIPGVDKYLKSTLYIPINNFILTINQWFIVRIKLELVYIWYNNCLVYIVILY